MLKIAPNNRDIEMTRGDTAYLQAVPYLDDGKTLYELQEGDNVILRIKSRPIFEKAADIDFENNTATITLVPEDTEFMDFQTYMYEIELVTLSEEHFTFIANARFTIGKEVEEHDT